MHDYLYVEENIKKIKEELSNFSGELVAVSKTYPPEAISQAYKAGQRIFGENRVQELCQKKQELPEDIEWHLIGHLQTNKVAQIIGHTALIHGVDSLKLLMEIDKQAEKKGIKAHCLLQIHISTEDTKFGFLPEQMDYMYQSQELEKLQNVQICGLMGMASFTSDTSKIRKEFETLKNLFDLAKTDSWLSSSDKFNILSMGMSSDYTIAIEEGSNMIRVGSAIFGVRKEATKI